MTLQAIQNNWSEVVVDVKPVANFTQVTQRPTLKQAARKAGKSDSRLGYDGAKADDQKSMADVTSIVEAQNRD